MGDERRVFQVLLHMVGNILNSCQGGGCLKLRIFLANESSEWHDKRLGNWRSNTSDGCVYVKFLVGVTNTQSDIEGTPSTSSFVDQRCLNQGAEGGLSFSVCRKLVKLMQGDIWVVANPEGFDQCMALVLQFQLRPSIVRGTSEFGESDYSRMNSLFRGLKVLVADDDNINRVVTKKLLEKLGCVVSCVSTGYECLSALGPALSSPQVVFLDLNMHDLDGFEVTMRIRKYRSRSWPLVIALTSGDDDNVKERCLQIGMNGIVRKPVLLQGIADELQRVLHSNRAMS